MIVIIKINGNDILIVFGFINIVGNCLCIFFILGIEVGILYCIINFVVVECIL